MVAVGLGVDVGYGHTKAVSSTGASVLFPSAVGLADAQHFRLEFNGRRSRPVAGQYSVMVFPTSMGSRR